MEVLGAAGISADHVTSVWVVMSRNRARMERLRRAGWTDLTGRSVLWTDQRLSLFSVLR